MINVLCKRSEGLAMVLRRGTTISGMTALLGRDASH